MMPRVIHQNLIDEDTEPINVWGPVLQTSLTDDDLARCLQRPDSPVGISCSYAKSQRLQCLAISNATNVLVIQFQNNNSTKIQEKLQRVLLCRDVGDLFAFDLAPLALSLFLDHGLRMDNGMDIQSACKSDRHPLESIKYALRDAYEDLVNEKNIQAAFSPETQLWDPSKGFIPLVQRSWLAYYVSQIDEMGHEFEEAKRVHMSSFTDDGLHLLAESHRASQQRDAMKPSKVTHGISSASGNREGLVSANQRKFSERIRRSRGQQVKVKVEGELGEYVVPAHIHEVKGKKVELRAGSTSLEGKSIMSITTIGQDGHTAAERKQALLLLQELQQGSKVLSNPWVQYISNGTAAVKWPKNFFPVSVPHEDDARSPSQRQYNRPLNESQINAVEHMLARGEEKCITVIQGPPGTGKTSVIAAFVDVALKSGQSGIWLVAQSNVAVKNIAEKLASCGFVEWRLLVSKEFHFEWHEHLYTQLSHNIIRSDRFFPTLARKLVGNAQVMLCTLSMLSSRPMLSAGFTRLVPFNTLVVDEASQILVHDYLPVFSKFRRTLRKICFIGDDKQLPPHGADTYAELQSVFEKPHLRENVLFLDTQYRMPPQIGDFISEVVYDGQLRSNPLHPITDSVVACHFINVSNGQEQRHSAQDQSWCNAAERKVILQIAKRFQEENRSYRIITPYDTQRNLIEQELQDNGLNWEDKCFNVDSFQGNEDDYIIISVVRSRRLGFLTEPRRVNVMLTRCKKGMIICSSRAFLTKLAASSLVGKLAASVGDKGWIETEDLDAADI